MFQLYVYSTTLNDQVICWYIYMCEIVKSSSKAADTEKKLNLVVVEAFIALVHKLDMYINVMCAYF